MLRIDGTGSPIVETHFTAGVSNTQPTGRMRPVS
jgi:hypothetical protein